MRELYLRSRWLENLEDSDLNRGIAITRFPALVGRSSECDYQIQQPLISRRHCSFYVRDEQIWVLDLGSLNGTYVNGERIKAPQPLHDRDQLELAFLPYEVCMPVASEGTPLP